MPYLELPFLGVLCLVALAVRIAWKKLFPLYHSPLLKLRGPPRDNLFYGHALRLGRVSDPRGATTWVDQYGPNVLTRWFAMVRSPRARYPLATHDYGRRFHAYGPWTPGQSIILLVTLKYTTNH